MIRINLLPEEYRKKARTPVKLVLGLVAAVVVNAGLATWWAWTAFGVRAEIDSEAAALQTEMDGLTPQVNYYNSLEGESKQYKSRENTLAGITSSRVSWTKKLDELIDTVNRGGNGQRHMVWFDDLQVMMSADPKAKTAGSLKASGHSGSDKFAQVANFLEDVENSPFISDFEPPAPPEGTQTLVDEKLVPSVVWAFPLSLSLKTVEERTAKSAPGAKGSTKSKDKSGATSPDGTKADPASPTTPPAKGATKPEAPKSDAASSEQQKSDAPKAGAPKSGSRAGATQPKADASKDGGDPKAKTASKHEEGHQS